MSRLAEVARSARVRVMLYSDARLRYTRRCVASSASVDCTDLPIVVMTIAGTPSIAALEVALRDFDALLARRVTYVLILDVTELDMVSAALRHRAARWLMENAILVKHCCRGVVCVATSPLARAAVTAMEWLDPRGDKYLIVGTMDEARRRARQRLVSIGIVVDTN